MSAVFADTAFYVAITNIRDTWNLKANSLVANLSDGIVTTEFILIEVGNFMRRSPEARIAYAEFMQAIRLDGNTKIVSASADLFSQGIDLFTQRLDKQWSLTDCISFAVMKAMQISAALTSDRHFEQAGFVPLLVNA
ncbi:MAG: type II toxin-antitoxin system VapC family toxin [Gemmataceae bacterium]